MKSSGRVWRLAILIALVGSVALSAACVAKVVARKNGFAAPSSAATPDPLAK